MNRIVVTYDEAGRITSTVSTDAISLEGMKNNYLEVDEFHPDYDSTHYVLDQVLTARPINTTLKTATGLINLPVPSTIVINGTPYSSSEAEAILDFTHPGTYEVIVESFPFQSAAFQISKS